MPRTLKLATSQFPVSDEIGNNMNFIKKQIAQAAQVDAKVIHFCECSLSAYAGIDFPKYTEKQNHEIQESIASICQQAQLYKIWVVFGTHLFEKGMKKPYNCTFVINSDGEIVHRYDKRFLSGFDLDWYAAGHNPGIFEIDGIKCGILICHEWRYPELYRQYYTLGVELLFQSWYDGNYSAREYREEGENLGEVIPGFVRGNAANNKLWISAANTCKKQQSFPAFVCRPDGFVTGKLKRNTTGLLFSEIEFDHTYIDLSSHLRDEALQLKF